MAAAHAAGIVHGDLKPENVMVTDEGTGQGPRLRPGASTAPEAAGRPDDTAELGLAEQGDGLFGTPRYLAPEQVRGEPACQASDVFSLGVILYELATGKMAFPAANLLQVLDQIRSVEPESPWPPRPPSRSRSPRCDPPCSPARAPARDTITMKAESPNRARSRPTCEASLRASSLRTDRLSP